MKCRLGISLVSEEGKRGLWKNMRVLLVSANTETINMPTFPLGMACVAQATLKAGHDLKWLDLMAEEDTAPVVKEAMETFHPEVVGISVRNVDDQNMTNPRFLLDRVREVVAQCRNSSRALIVLGGAGYSLFPQSALRYLGADMGIQGEGESVFPALLESLEKGLSLSGLPGLYLQGSGLQGNRYFEKDLDRLPLPVPHLFSTSAYEGEDFWVPVQTRRGCPMNCSYCSTGTIEGRVVRRRSPEMIVKWLADHMDAGFKRFQFVDNTFNLPPAYAMSLCSHLGDAPFRTSWRCILYPGKIQERLVRAMAEAGCKEVSLGFESGCDTILKGMNKRFKKQDVRNAVRMLSNYAIRTMGFLMLGGPGETRDTAEESLQFVEELDLSGLKITIGIRIYPNTNLAKIASEEGLITGDDLLFPRFYMVKRLEPWLRKTVQQRTKEHRNWHA
jgi:radical SAM superfamily enzyme YgiQ (UPF0313 family)